ncbi:hypothetical protein [Microcella indica]|uniref:hypothetical protein n=1 Tax=Microcella indica TaxID=2750620 RepID=UPI0015CF607E|nr:hypothetical protein [Microcella indica]
MADWFVRYQEGYVTLAGQTVTLADELRTERSWKSREEAWNHWSRRADLAGPDVHVSANGFEQVHDVRERPEFRVLNVVRIWRRLTFARA